MKIETKKLIQEILIGMMLPHLILAKFLHHEIRSKGEKAETRLNNPYFGIALCEGVLLCLTPLFGGLFVVAIMGSASIAGGLANLYFLRELT